MTFRNNVVAPTVGIGVGIGTFLLSPGLSGLVAGTITGIIGHQMVKKD